MVEAAAEKAFVGEKRTAGANARMIFNALAA
jgi:hypothetical protein